MILTKFLGICPFVGVSDDEESGLGMGLAVTLVITVSSILTYFIHHYILIPTNTEYLRTIVFILVIASLVQMIEIIMRRYFPRLHKLLGLYLPLITTNCAVLGVILLNVFNNYNLIQTIVFAFGSSIGFLLVIYIFSTIREKIRTNPIIKSFTDFPIALITAGIMALIFLRYIGG
ncbi:MAG: Rnf-Nqr domain containing protein [Bacilli bacterium]|nr:Rnf-Nqr domain containing protein [Bacilli bacterium]